MKNGTPAPAQRTLGDLANDMWWMKTIGAAAIAAAVSFSVWMMTSFVPAERERATNDAVAKAKEEILTPLDRRLLRIEVLLNAQQVNAAASEPDRATAAGALRVALVEARQQGVQIEPAPLTRLGQTMATIAANGSPSAIAASTDVAAYLTQFAMPMIPSTAPEPVSSQTLSVLTFRSVDERLPLRRPRVEAFGRATPPALMTDIGREGETVLRGQGPALFVVDGDPDGRGITTDIRLDGAAFRNVVLKNLAVTWEGGPVSLTNVTFVNCLFNFARRPFGSQVVAQVLTAMPVTARTS